MKKVLFFSLALLFTVTLLGSGCAKKAVEEKVEDDIEEATNGEADVDIDDNSVNINTDDASIEIGESVEVPADFPSDVYIIDGTVVLALEIEENNGYTLNIQTDKPVAEAKAEYQNQLEAEGWAIDISMDLGGSSSLSAQKDSRYASVTISEVDGQTTVVLSTGSSE